MIKPVSLFFILGTFLLLAACQQSKEIVPEVFQARNSHEAYLLSLERAGISETALARDWKNASKSVLSKPLKIEIPFAEDFFVDPTEAQAVAYKFEGKRGHRIEIEIMNNPEDSFQIFVDVFRVIDAATNSYVHIASASDDLFLAFEPRAQGKYILRFQTELLRGGKFSLHIHKNPALAFPVLGKDKAAIGSLFGAPRGGGKRKHHGVDIFAKKHTPIIAPTEGRIKFVGERGLGGKVVWMRDIKRNQTLYFAHLERILVDDGVYVYPGDTLGTVGNTGNARTTPSHLHFGIYKNGPIDPYDFIANTTEKINKGHKNNEFLGKIVRAVAITKMKINGMTKESDIIDIPKFQIMKVVGSSSFFYRVRLPDDIEGYIESSYIELADMPIKHLVINASNNLLSSPTTHAFDIDEILQGEEIKVLGENEDYNYIEKSSGEKGWIRSMSEGI